MIDYTRGENLASDIIIPNLLRVSTATFPSDLGLDPLIETWIFSGIPNQKSRQIFHCNRETAIKAHNHIVRNLREKWGKP